MPRDGRFREGLGAKMVPRGCAGAARWAVLVVVASVLVLYVLSPYYVGNTSDDGFYYLKIARNVAETGTVSFDGVHGTNGFHPLWMGLLTLAYAVSSPSAAQALVIAGVLQAVLVVLSLALLYHNARYMGAAACPWLALGVFAWPRIVGYGMRGLETALYVFLLLALIAHSARYGIFAPGRPRRAAVAASGFLVGLTLLCRLDSVFIVLVALAYYAVLCVRRAKHLPAAAREFLVFAAPVLLLAGAFIAANYARFGHIMPISGSIKRSFPVPGPYSEWVLRYPESMAMVCVVAYGVAAAYRDLRSAQGTAVLPESLLIAPPLIIIGTGTILHFADSVLFMMWGAFPWHFAPYGVPAALLIPWLLARRLHWETASPARPCASQAVALILLAGVLVPAWVAACGRYQASRDGWVAQGKRAAEWANTHLPHDALLGMRDSGAFGYFCEPPTVNLDGLVNDYRLRQYEDSGWLGQYIADTGIRYLASHTSIPGQAEPETTLSVHGLPAAQGRVVYSQRYLEPEFGLRDFVIIEILEPGTPARIRGHWWPP